MIVGGLGLSVVPFFFWKWPNTGRRTVWEFVSWSFFVYNASRKEFCASRKEFLNKSRRIPNWTRNSWLFVRDVSGWIPVPCLVSQVSATIYRFMYSLYSDIEIYWVCLQIQQLYILRYWAYIYIYNSNQKNIALTHVDLWIYVFTGI